MDTERHSKDVWNDLSRVGEAIDAVREAESLAARLRKRVGELRALCDKKPRPRVACIEWLDPLMAVILFGFG